MRQLSTIFIIKSKNREPRFQLSCCVKILMLALPDYNFTCLASLFRQKINDEISTISKHRVGELTKLWEELFEPEICKDHMRKLTQHVEAFFSDIFRETEERKIAIVENIESELNLSFYMELIFIGNFFKNSKQRKMS